MMMMTSCYESMVPGYAAPGAGVTAYSYQQHPYHAAAAWQFAGLGYQRLQQQHQQQKFDEQFDDSAQRSHLPSQHGVNVAPSYYGKPAFTTVMVAIGRIVVAAQIQPAYS